MKPKPGSTLKIKQSTRARSTLAVQTFSNSLLNFSAILISLGKLLQIPEGLHGILFGFNLWDLNLLLVSEIICRFLSEIIISRLDPGYQLEIKVFTISKTSDINSFILPL